VQNPENPDTTLFDVIPKNSNFQKNEFSYFIIFNIRLQYLQKIKVQDSWFLLELSGIAITMQINREFTSRLNLLG